MKWIVSDGLFPCCRCCCCCCWWVFSRQCLFVVSFLFLSIAFPSSSLHSALNDDQQRGCSRFTDLEDLAKDIKLKLNGGLDWFPMILFQCSSLLALVFFFFSFFSSASCLPSNPPPSPREHLLSSRCSLLPLWTSSSSFPASIDERSDPMTMNFRWKISTGHYYCWNIYSIFPVLLCHGLPVLSSRPPPQTTKEETKKKKTASVVTWRANQKSVCVLSYSPPFFQVVCNANIWFEASHVTPPIRRFSVHWLPSVDSKTSKALDFFFHISLLFSFSIHSGYTHTHTHTHWRTHVIDCLLVCL